MIKSLRIQNIKGTTIDQNLTGKDIFIGPNGIGKSTRLQALILAMLGYIPTQGKTNAETFKLSTGEEMLAGMQTDHFSFDRIISRNEKLNMDGTRNVSYSESLSVSPSKGEKNATQMKSRVTAEIGNFPIVFDFQEFMKMSDPKRREFIYSLSPISTDEWDRDKISSRLVSNLLTAGLKETNADLYETTQELINNALKQWPESYDLQSGLQSMISWVSAQQSIYNKEEKDAQGAVRELSKIKNQLTETDRDIAENKADLKSIRDQRTDINGQIQSGKEIKRQWDQKKARMEQLKVELQKISDDLAKPDENDSEAKIQSLQSEIKELDISEESKKIQSQINQLQADQQAKQTEREGLQPEVNRIQAEISTIENVAKAINEKGASVCVIHSKIACDKDFSKFLNHADDRTPKLKERLNEIELKKKELAEQITALKQQEREFTTQKDKLYEELTAQNQKNKSLNSQIDSIKQADQKRQQEKRDLEARKKMNQEESERLENEKMPEFAPLDILEKQYESLTTQISQLEAKLEEQEKSKITLSNLQTSMISGSKAQYYHAACKNLSAEIGPKGIQGDLVKGILGPIEDAINDNLLLMGIKHPVFFSTESETGKETFQFGWIKNDRETNFDVLSTGEQLMFLSAFLVTLLERANPPLKVLAIDNIENLWTDNFKNFLEGLSALSHKLDNILLAGAVSTVVRKADLPDNTPQFIKDKFVVLEDLEVAGWKVTDLTPVEKKEAVASA